MKESFCYKSRIISTYIDENINSKYDNLKLNVKRLPLSTISVTYARCTIFSRSFEVVFVYKVNKSPYHVLIKEFNILNSLVLIRNNP